MFGSTRRSSSACRPVHPPSRRAARRGISLFELVVVLTIIGIIAAMATPRYAQSIARFHATMAADRIAADLKLARQRAITRGIPQDVRFYLAQDKYKIMGMNDFDDPTRAYQVFLGQDPYRADLLSTNFGITVTSGSAKLTFDVYGVPSNGGQIVVGVGEWTRTVTLDGQTGRARVN